ncbi:MAG: tryptophan-rich sensory protein [Candidatus Bathyarchaeota archaeon]|nr:tryptophan-rich sensory protein [Candidatus Bathyarchaeota archaeon]
MNSLRVGNIIALIVTLIVNGLAGTTLLNGRTTAEVSDTYFTLITPAGYVFSIWGVIYILLAAFAVYQALPSQKDKPYQKQIGALFILSSVFNCVWLFLWQYDYITLSVVVMFALLATLISIYTRLGVGKSKAPLREKLLIQTPFSVYLGWITIASIANVSAALVSVNWDRLGISADTWAVVVLALALVVALAVIFTRRDIAYSLVIIWALAGIAINQSSYPNIVLTAEVAITIIVVALVATLIVFWLRRRHFK